LQWICSPLRLYEITTCEYALQKAQCVETNDNGLSTALLTRRLEEKIEHLQQMIKNMSIRRNELWCTSCCKEGHMKETCSLNDQPPATTYAHKLQAQKYCHM